MGCLDRDPLGLNSDVGWKDWMLFDYFDTSNYNINEQV